MAKEPVSLGGMPLPGYNPKRPEAKILDDLAEAMNRKNEAAAKAGSKQAAVPASPPVSLDVWSPALNWVSAQYKAMTEKKPGKEQAGGSTASAQRAIKRRKEAIAATRAEMAQEARTTRGPNYYRLQERLKKEQADLEKAERNLAAAERANSQAQAMGAGAQAAALVGGVVSGGYFANKLDKRYSQSSKATQSQIKRAAKSAEKLIAKVENAGKMTPSDRAKLRSLGKTHIPRSSVGLLLAGTFVASGALTRQLAGENEDVVAKSALNAVAAGEIGLALGALKSAVPNAAASVANIPADEIASLRAAKDLAKNHPVTMPKGAKKPSPAKRKTSARAKGPTLTQRVTSLETKVGGRAAAKIAKASKVLPRAILPVVGVGVFGASLYQGAGVAKAAQDGADALTGGSLSEYARLRKRGNNQALSALGAADAFLAMGLGQAVVRSYQDRKPMASRRAREARRRKMSARRLKPAATSNLASQIASKAKPAAAKKPEAGNRKRGTQNKANLKAILRSRKKAAVKGTRKKPERKRKARSRS